MIEAEMAFVSSLKDLATEAELLIKAIMRSVIEKGASDLHTIEAPEPFWLDKDFGFLTYDEAVDILEAHASRLTFPMKRGDGFSKEHELFLVEHNGNVPVFIIDWPKNNKPFYMKECKHDESKVT